MSLAKAIIGEPVAKPESKTQEAKEPKVIHAMDLIDALAEQELREDEGVGKPSDGEQPDTGNVKNGEKDKGKLVAKCPGTVTYGSKGSSKNPVSYGKE